MDELGIDIDELVGSIAMLAYAQRESVDIQQDFYGSLEELVAEGFGIPTLTPLQRAICRVVSGEPLGDLINNPHVKSSIGDASVIDGVMVSRIVLLAGIRTFKSVLAAAVAIWVSQHCDVSHLGPGETPRFSIVSVKLDLGQVIFSHLVGNIMATPKLSALLTGQPTADTVTLKHPSGCPVEVKVVAGSRAGASLVARWSAGCVFDEAPRMVGASEGVINLDDARDAVVGRLLPGAQILEIGSPWADYGPVFDTVTKYEQRPSEALVVVRAQAHWLNPVWWTAARREKLKKENPTAYKTDVLAEFVGHEESLYPRSLLDGITRDGPAVIDYQPGHEYIAAMDPATRGNAWAFVVADRIGPMKRIVYAAEWKGSPVSPLSPRTVLKEIAEVLRAYRLGWAYTDQWAADANKDIAHEEGIDLVVEEWTHKSKVDAFLSLAIAFADGTVELPPVPALLKDLQLTKKKATQNGVSVVLSKTPDGRHCDYAPTIAKALHRWIEEEHDMPPEQGTPEHSNWVAQQIEDREDGEFEEQESRAWWDS